MPELSSVDRAKINGGMSLGSLGPESPTWEYTLSQLHANATTP